MNINSLLEDAMEQNPEKEILFACDRWITYRELYRMVNQLACQLWELGVRRGTRVALADQNSLEMVLYYFAVSRLGGVFVPLSSYTCREQLIQMLDTTAPEFLTVNHSCQYLGTYAKHASWKCRGIFSLVDEDYFQDEQEERLCICEELEEDEPNLVLFTSGVKDTPRAIVYGLGGLMELISSESILEKSDQQELILVSAPFFHAMGYLAVMRNLYHGNPFYLLRSFTPEKWRKIVRTCNITHAMIAPMQVQQVIESGILEQNYPGPLRSLGIGGDELPPALIQETLSYLPVGAEIINTYLTTETFSIARIHWKKKDEGEINWQADECQRLSSVGRILDSVQIQIQRKDASLCRPGEIGEIFVRKPRAFLGYLDPKTHKQILKTDIWIQTGDIGYLGKKGNLYLLGHVGKLERTDVVETAITKQTDMQVLPVWSKGTAIFPEYEPLTSPCFLMQIGKVWNITQELQSCLDLEELKKRYLLRCSDMLPLSSWSILMPNASTDGLPRIEMFQSDQENSRFKWDRVRPADMISFVVGSQSAGIEQLFPGQEPNGELCHVLVVPILSPQRKQLCMLTFGRTKEDGPFLQEELFMIRLMSQQFTVALINAIRHTELTNRCSFWENMLYHAHGALIFSTVCGKSILFSKETEDLLHTPGLVFTSGQTLEDAVMRNVKLLTDTSSINAVSLVQMQIKNQPKTYQVTTARVDGSLESYYSLLREIGYETEIPKKGPELTEREKEILELILNGYTNEDLSKQLFISLNTVKFHVRNILRKFCVTSRTELLIKLYGDTQK